MCENNNGRCGGVPRGTPRKMRVYATMHSIFNIFVVGANDCYLINIVKKLITCNCTLHCGIVWVASQGINEDDK